MNLTKSDSLELHFESSTDILFISVAQIILAMNKICLSFCFRNITPLLHAIMLKLLPK